MNKNNATPKQKNFIGNLLYNNFKPFYLEDKYINERKYYIYSSQYVSYPYKIVVITKFKNNKPTSNLKSTRPLSQGQTQEIIDCLNNSEYSLVDNCWISKDNDKSKIYISYGKPNLENFHTKNFKNELKGYSNLKSCIDKKIFIGGVRKYFEPYRKKEMKNIFNKNYIEQIFKYFNKYDLSHPMSNDEKLQGEDDKYILKRCGINKKIKDWSDDDWITFCNSFVDELQFIYELIMLYSNKDNK